MSQFGALRAPGEPAPSIDAAALMAAEEPAAAPATVIYVHQAPSVDLPYASWLSRVAAFLIDTLVAAALIVVLGGGGAALSGSGAGVLFGFVAAFLYFPLMHATATGQTLGKRAMGIALKGADGEQVDLVRAFVRSLVVGLFVVVPLLALLDLLAPLSDEKRRAIHDKAVGTIVVETSR